VALCRTQFFTATFCEPNCLGRHAREQCRISLKTVFSGVSSAGFGQPLNRAILSPESERARSCAPPYCWVFAASKATFLLPFRCPWDAAWRGATAAALAILGRFKTKKAANGGSRPCMACRESKLEAESRIDAIADYGETVDYALGMSEQ